MICVQCTDVKQIPLCTNFIRAHNYKNSEVTKGGLKYHNPLPSLGILVLIEAICTICHSTIQLHATESLYRKSNNSSNNTQWPDFRKTNL